MKDEQKFPIGISQKGERKNPLTIRECQIKTTMGFHFIPICCQNL